MRRFVEHSEGRRAARRARLPIGQWARSRARCWTRSASLAGAVEIDPTPQEVPWSVPLDEDDEHTSYDPAEVAAYFAAATRAALVLAAFRAPYRGRSTPVNAWWGSFDLAVNLFSGLPADPPSRRLHHAQRDGCAGGRDRLVAWRSRYGKAAFYAYAHPAPEGFAAATLSPAAARWDARSASTSLTGTTSAEPRPACGRARVRPLSVSPRMCVCDWDPVLAATAEGRPPPVV